MVALRNQEVLDEDEDEDEDELDALERGTHPIDPAAARPVKAEEEDVALPALPDNLVGLVLKRTKGRFRNKTPVAKRMNCGVCDKNLTVHHLSRHMRIHTGERPYACDQCPATFTMWRSHTYHVQARHGTRLACDDCGKTFAHRMLLDAHQRFVHRGEKPHVCNVCEDFGAKDITGLRQHMNTHTGDRPYACQVCPWRFAQPNNLTVHMRIHTGERPYACPECPRRFKHVSSLKDHKRAKHSDERAFACTVPGCTKTFKIEQALRNHAKVHSDKRPFPCRHPPCTLAFKRVDTRDKHEFGHTRTSQYKCDCHGRMFRDRTDLNAHIKSQ
jgi:KRAB domain-containing zinc finger protein